MSLVESRFSRSATMGSKMEKQKKVTILIISLSMGTEYSAVFASVSTLREEQETWEYVSMLFIEKQKRWEVNEKSHISLPPADKGKGKTGSFIKKKSSACRR